MSEINLSRYQGRVRWEYEVEVITPLFLHGADPAKAELRPASFRGVLRFWWRASKGREMSLAEMKRREAEIFGSTEKKSNVKIFVSQRSPFQITGKSLGRVNKFSITVNTKNTEGRVISISMNPLDYLAFGCCSYDKDQKCNVYKEYIKPENKFLLVIEFPERYQEDIKMALSCLHHFGGVGGRSRNGYGSLCFHPQGDTPNLFSREELWQRLKSRSLSSYTAFSEKTEKWDISSRSTWEEALSELGQRYYEARRELVLARRVLIAKPLIQIGVKDRYAKRYFFHVRKENDTYKGSVLFLPCGDDKDFLGGDASKFHDILTKTNAGGNQ